MPKIDWLSFAFGIAFVLFIWPFVSRLLGKARGTVAAKTAA